MSGKEMLSHLYKKTGKVNKSMILYRKTNTKLFFNYGLTYFEFLLLIHPVVSYFIQRVPLLALFFLILFILEGQITFLKLCL